MSHTVRLQNNICTGNNNTVIQYNNMNIDTDNNNNNVLLDDNTDNDSTTTSSYTTEDELEYQQIQQKQSNILTTTNKPHKHKQCIHQCRICLSHKINNKYGQLVTPCKCSGSMKYVHLNCIQQWRRISKNVLSYIYCEQCCSLYKHELPYINIKRSILDYWLNNETLLYKAQQKLLNNKQYINTYNSDDNTITTTENNCILQQYYNYQYPKLHPELDIQLAQRFNKKYKNNSNTYNKYNITNYQQYTIIRLLNNYFIQFIFKLILQGIQLLLLPLLILLLTICIEYCIVNQIDLISNITFTIKFVGIVLLLMPISTALKYICNIVFQYDVDRVDERFT